MRTKKIALNILCDILPYILIGIVGLIKVNFLIKYIGDVGNGYYQVINQIISYVFLAQAGFGDAVIYALYKPFAEKNKHDINAIYSGARKVFKIIGLVILGLIILVSGALYLFYGFEDGFRNSAIICFAIIASSYLISYFGKTQTYMTVLSAAQEKYIFSTVFNSVKLACDIAIVYVTYRFQTLEAIAITILIAKIIEEIIMRIVVSRKYKWLKEIDEKNTSMVGMMKDLIWVQIGFLMLNNIDSILLMGFVGPVVVSIYTSYNFVLRYLNEVASRVEQGAVYSIFLAKTPTGKIARQIEKNIIDNGITGLVTTIYKMKNIVYKENNSDIKKLLLKNYKDIIDYVSEDNKKYLIEPEFNYFSSLEEKIKDIMLIEKIQINLFDENTKDIKSYDIRKDMNTISGKYLYSLGKILAIENNGKIELIDTKKLEGSLLDFIMLL